MHSRIEPAPAFDLSQWSANLGAPWQPSCGGGRDGTPGAVPHLRWGADLPGPRVNAAAHAESASPVVVGPVVLVGSAGGRGLYAVSRASGELLQTFAAEGSVQAAPALDAATGAVYFGDTAGNLWAYDARGGLRWSWQTGAPVVGSVTLVDGRIYAANVDDSAFALDAATGEVVWQYHQKPDRTRDSDLALYASPSVTVAGGVAYAGFSDGTLVALDAGTGAVSWSKRIGEGRYPDLVAAPLVVGDELYVAGYFGPLLALDIRTQAVRWRVDVGAAAPALPGADHGVKMLYQPDTDGGLHAIVALTGAEKWVWRSGTEGAVTTPVQTPEGLWIGSSDGSFYLVDAETGAQRWTWAEPADLEGVSASPDVDGRDLFLVSNGGRLYALSGVKPRGGADGLGWRRPRP